MCTCVHMGMEVRGQFKGVDSLLPLCGDQTQVISLSTELSHWPKNILISEHKRVLSKDYGLWFEDKLHPQAQEQMSRCDHFPLSLSRSHNGKGKSQHHQKMSNYATELRESSVKANIHERNTVAWHPTTARHHSVDPLRYWQATGFLSPAHPPRPHRHFSL